MMLFLKSEAINGKNPLANSTVASLPFYRYIIIVTQHHNVIVELEEQSQFISGIVCKPI